MRMQHLSPTPTLLAVTDSERKDGFQPDRMDIFRTVTFLSFRAVRGRYGKIVSRLSFLSYHECYFILSLFAIAGPAAIIQARPLAAGGPDN
jgi:hypothetical protein